MDSHDAKLAYWWVVGGGWRSSLILLSPSGGRKWRVSKINWLNKTSGEGRYDGTRGRGNKNTEKCWLAMENSRNCNQTHLTSAGIYLQDQKVWMFWICCSLSLSLWKLNNYKMWTLTLTKTAHCQHYGGKPCCTGTLVCHLVNERYEEKGMDNLEIILSIFTLF